MIIDKSLVFSGGPGTSGQLATGAADITSTNIIDMGAAKQAYEALWLIVQVNAACAPGSPCTVSFQLQTDITATFGSPITVFDSGAYPTALLVANANPVKTRLPLGLKQFLRLNYHVVSGPLSSGAFSAFLAMDVTIP